MHELVTTKGLYFCGSTEAFIRWLGQLDGNLTLAEYLRFRLH